jgi:hypothetical protein
MQDDVMMTWASDFSLKKSDVRFVALSLSHKSFVDGFIHQPALSVTRAALLPVRANANRIGSCMASGPE